MASSGLPLPNRVFAAGVAGVVLFLVRDDSLPAVTALLPLATVWLGLIAVFLYLRQTPEERPPFPLMALTGLFYAMFFGLPAFFAFRLHDPETGKIHFFGDGYVDAISLEAQALVIGGMALMWAAYAGSRRTIWRSIPHLGLQRAFSLPRLQVLLWGLALGHLAYLYSPVVRALPSAGQFLQPVGYLAFGMFYLLWCRVDLPRWQAAVVFLVVLPLALVAVLTTGAMAIPVLILIFFAVLYLRVRGRPPWLVIVAIPVFFPGGLPDHDLLPRACLGGRGTRDDDRGKGANVCPCGGGNLRFGGPGTIRTGNGGPGPARHPHPHFDPRGGQDAGPGALLGRRDL